jgi:hypothetical protein
MSPMLSLILGFAIIAGIVGAVLAALYLAWWLVLLAIRRVPMIGRRRRHPEWDRLNRS